MARPLLIYDGDCSFCKLWVGYWKKLTGEQVAYVPYQEVAEQLPNIPRENFKAAVQFVSPEGQVYSAAEAVFRALAYAPQKRWPLWLYENVPAFAPVSEGFYHFVTRHRNPLYKVTRLLWGTPQPPQYARMRAIFLRLLAAIYFIAFASWYVQIPGLIGSQGILPAASFLLRVRQQIGARAYFLLPTLAWLHPSDSLIRGLAAAGIGISLLAVLGIALGPCMLLLWALYLSQVVVGGDFMAFQWDVLLLETGFLAIFFAPWTLRLTRLKSTDEPSHVMVWLFRWLLFRLMLLSGAVKLLSSDASWHKLTALEYHFYTQPLPNVVAWYAASLPAAFLKGCTAAMFAVELGVPFLIFLPRRPRRLAAIILIVFQALILATGNYTFFNLLAMALCVTLVEDVPPASGRPRVSAGGRRYVIGAVAAVILWVSCAQLVRTFAGRSPESGDPITSTLAPFYIANTYGLFAVMTTMRVEIIMQGSDDGQTWKDYEFKYKPGDPKRTPPWVAPHQPRLDWQMWFAALSNYRANPWFINFAYRLLQGSPDVLRLLKTNPFPEHPPYYVRALAYEYTFTSSSERRATGAWWNRKPLGSYLPPVSLKSFHQ